MPIDFRHVYERRLAVKNRVIFAAAAILTVGVGAACSPRAVQWKPQSATLPAGTARVTVTDKDASTTDSVQCSTVGSLTTIKTGDEASGATVMVSNGGELTVELIRVRNVSGFTGDYDAGLQGEATVAMMGATYDIIGTALGYSPKSFERITQPIRIKVAC